MLSLSQLLPMGSLAVKGVLQLLEVLHLKGVSGGKEVLQFKGIFEGYRDPSFEKGPSEVKGSFT